jgi:hypothetical protein
MLLCYILEVYIYIYIYIYVVIFYLFNDWTHTIIDYCSQSILSKINFKSSNHLIYFYEVFVYIFRYKIYEKYLCLFWNETLKECPINQFNHTTFFACPKAGPFNIICCGLFYVQCFEVRGYCSFCWYWWNCRPSLFKLSFYNISDDWIYI